MKKTYVMTALLVLVSTLTATVQAQTNNHKVAHASIPFEFNIGDKRMPAGEYTIRQVSPSSEPGLLRIANDKGAFMLLRTQLASGTAAKKTVLLFNRYGSHYFFSRVAIEGLDTWQASRSRAERGMAREFAVLNAKAEAVTVATR